MDSDHELHSHNANGERDSDEQIALARDLGSSMTDLFEAFVKAEISFDALVFESFQTIQDLFVIASGEYEIEYVDEEVDEEIDR